uniref:Uncharacterized protein n=1 Tax=Chromera velia CCMP2878 TaxID=1169474 RepID=A0A0G4IE01_9ALVE|eukprot:Cvel_13452.t1-p1 / transcript=Cvel_13452.t1 / gene=Cvel_13452 / organism=Chromera_velia_CCMP2878 / gene_product=hypothetical protein / transcript_product=hypothetical protein / location=Cvel_scaffold919:38199-40067(-) / protein_length=236 / sequence_SO=supercontig / SO=protein_coding / is_pseudo=false
MRLGIPVAGFFEKHPTIVFPNPLKVPDFAAAVTRVTFSFWKVKGLAVAFVLFVSFAEDDLDGSGKGPGDFLPGTLARDSEGCSGGSEQLGTHNKNPARHSILLLVMFVFLFVVVLPKWVRRCKLKEQKVHSACGPPRPGPWIDGVAVTASREEYNDKLLENHMFVRSSVDDLVAARTALSDPPKIACIYVDSLLDPRLQMKRLYRRGSEAIKELEPVSVLMQCLCEEYRGDEDDLK